MRYYLVIKGQRAVRKIGADAFHVWVKRVLRTEVGHNFKTRLKQLNDYQHDMGLTGTITDWTLEES